MATESVGELERRLAVALDRIARGLDRMAAAAPAARPDPEVARLREALEAERAEKAQLAERVKAIKERQETHVGQLERRLSRLTEQADVQGLELQRLKKALIQLREANRLLREAQEAGVADPAAINRSLQAEVEALRAARTAEIAELDEILAELRPLVGEGTDA